MTTLLQRATFRTSRLGGPIAQFMLGDKKEPPGNLRDERTGKERAWAFLYGQDDLRPEITIRARIAARARGAA